MVSNGLDPVAQRLAASGEQNSSMVLEWIEHQEQRRAMNRQASWCSFSGWLLVTAAAIVSSFVAFMMAQDAQELYDEDFITAAMPWSVSYLPFFMLAVTILLLGGGLVGWLCEMIPGLSSFRSANDWASAGDAMNRLLSVGCTYPEAFRTTAKVMKTRGSRRWFDRAASRVERGGDDVVVADVPEGDSTVLELMIESSESEPGDRWSVAAYHFFEVAQRRLAFLLGASPILATIIAGLLVWLSIAATLGWMWKAVADMVVGLQ